MSLCVPGAAVIQQRKLSNSVKSGANWLLFIGIASAVNSIIIASGSQWSLVAWLGLTQITTLIAQAFFINHGLITYLSIIVGLIFGFLSLFANRQHLWAIIVGIVLYALDGLLFLLIQDWFGVAFHALALYGMLLGVRSMLALRTLRAAEPVPPTTSIENEGDTVSRVGVAAPRSDAAFVLQQRQQTQSLLRHTSIAVVITLIAMGLFALPFYL